MFKFLSVAVMATVAQSVQLQEDEAACPFSLDAKKETPCPHAAAKAKKEAEAKKETKSKADDKEPEVCPFSLEAKEQKDCPIAAAKAAAEKKSKEESKKEEPEVCPLSLEAKKQETCPIAAAKAAKAKKDEVVYIDGHPKSLNEVDEFITEVEEEVEKRKHEEEVIASDVRLR